MIMGSGEGREGDGAERRESGEGQRGKKASEHESSMENFFFKFPMELCKKKYVKVNMRIKIQWINKMDSVLSLRIE